MSRFSGLKRSATGREEGFTLIELLVVVLIIGILIAIIIPLFLGQRTRAEDRAAQSILRDGLANAKTFYSDADSYNGFTPAAGKSVDPTINWVANAAALAGADHLTSVAIVQAFNHSLLLVTLSDSGEYFGMADQASTAGTTLCKSATLPTWTDATQCVGGW